MTGDLEDSHLQDTLDLYKYVHRRSAARTLFRGNTVIKFAYYAGTPCRKQDSQKAHKTG